MLLEIPTFYSSFFFTTNMNGIILYNPEMTRSFQTFKKFFKDQCFFSFHKMYFASTISYYISLLSVSFIKISPLFFFTTCVCMYLCACLCACTYALLYVWIYLKLSVWAWVVQVHLRDSDISMLLYCLCFNEAYFERSLIMLSSNFNYSVKSKH